MEFKVLGPLEVCDQERALPLGGSKQRALLGVLLLHVNEVVAADRLVDELWGEQPPGSAAKLVQGYVSGLRRLLVPAVGGGAGPLVTQAPGYVIRLAPDELDMFAFERLVVEARAAADPQTSAELLRRALALWRGPALGDVTLEGFARQEAERLNERRRTALIDRIELDLELGRHADVVGELEALVAQHPFQERLRAQLMLALYRSGRQAEALRVYQETRRTLVDELGLEPGEELQRLERAILAHDPVLDAPPAQVEDRPPAPAAPEEAPRTSPDARSRVRKTVTVVFSDVVEWSSLAERLDPESLHQVQARYYEETAAVLERHGGTVEKFIGDAAVAVFGIPVLHEDDALRAVRAAAELHEVVSLLNEELARDWGLRLTVHTGVNTGEVVTGLVTRGHSLASGDTVIVAARLQQAAKSGEILLGPDTYRLVGNAVRAEPLEPLVLKGRTAAVPAWRLVDLTADLPSLTAPTFAPLVGRVEELGALVETLARVSDERSCQLCTVIGPPGIGKSRLVRELADSVDDALVVVGRCRPYGDGITFWPLAEIVKQLAGDEPQAWIAALLAADERAPLIAERVAGAIGLVETIATPQETFWAVRKLFEGVARESPLIVVVDDVHWAEPTLLELLEYVVGFSTGAPILLLCLARPELLDNRPAWSTPRPSTRLIPLEPLSEDESRQLLEHLPHAGLSDQALDRVVGAAEGNPLFLEQLHAFQAEQTRPGQPVPPTIQALLSARIDRLEPDARTVLERASIEGRTFHLGALAELLPAPVADELSTHLMTLVRKEFIRSDRSRLPDEEAFRFRHILIRDAAYASIPKLLRSELHECYAGWLERRAGGTTEHGEIVGYHLEQAVRNRDELGLIDRADDDLGTRAAGLLAAAGRRASTRGDMPAAAGLLERALALLPADHPDRPALQIALGDVLIEVGRFQEAEGAFAEAVETGDRAVACRAQLERAFLGIFTGAADWFETLVRATDEAVSVFAELGDDAAVARALRMRVDAYWVHCQVGGMEEVLEQALEHAVLAGAQRELSLIQGAIARVAAAGPMPADLGVERCRRILVEAADTPATEAMVLCCIAYLEAMRGDFEEARAHSARSRSMLQELGMTVARAASDIWACEVELLAGELSAAERLLRSSYETLEAAGERGNLSTIAALLAEAVRAQGSLDEAERLTQVSEELAADDDALSQVAWRSTRAKLQAASGDVESAERLAREAVEVAERTDWPNLRGDALSALAEVHAAAGRRAAAAEVAERAAAVFEAKGNVSAAALLSALRAPAAAPASTEA
jgi:class 3 adenylate cyclase